MIRKASNNPKDILTSLEPDFMPVSNFLTDEKIKTHVDKEEYNKMKLAVLQAMIHERNKIKTNSK